jgi:hypothetical protein
VSSTLTELDIRALMVTALTSHLGTYRYINGVTEPAFKATDGRYRAKGDPWPHGPEVPKVTGLEAVLEVDVEAPDFTPLMSRDYFLRRRCRLTLKQWDITSTVRAASSAVLVALNNARLTDIQPGPRVPRDSRVDNIETQSFTFTYTTET